MEQPVICVIVPVYKAEATLPRCIESVLTQQLPGGLRLILVDDQSPDRSGEICDAYAAKDPRVMVLHRRERGVSGARNAGLRAATGEYIVFLDSDDALRPGALAAALAAQAAAPNAFVLWHYTMQPDDTTPVTTVAHPAQQSDLARLHRGCLPAAGYAAAAPRGIAGFGRGCRRHFAAGPRCHARTPRQSPHRAAKSMAEKPAGYNAP